jgi:hypothetical protein
MLVHAFRLAVADRTVLKATDRVISPKDVPHIHACVKSLVFSPFGSLWDSSACAEVLVRDRQLEPAMQEVLLRLTGDVSQRDGRRPKGKAGSQAGAGAGAGAGVGVDGGAEGWTFERSACALLYSELLTADKAAVLIRRVTEGVERDIFRELRGPALVKAQALPMGKRDAEVARLIEIEQAKDPRYILCSSYRWALPSAPAFVTTTATATATATAAAGGPSKAAGPAPRMGVGEDSQNGFRGAFVSFGEPFLTLNRSI